MFDGKGWNREWEKSAGNCCSQAVEKIGALAG
jgi:hypothetical protein